MSSAERVCGASSKEQVNELAVRANERTDGRACGPVLTFRFLAVDVLVIVIAMMTIVMPSPNALLQLNPYVLFERAEDVTGRVGFGQEKQDIADFSLQAQFGLHGLGQEMAEGNVVFQAQRVTD